MDRQSQKDILFQSYLNNYFKENNLGRKHIGTLELIISSYCNQECEYCYLYKFGSKMYPLESNKKENILNNLPLLLDYLYFEQKCDWDVYDIFSGEFFVLDYWEDIFQIFYDFELKIKNLTTKTVTVPTNMSWLLNDSIYKKVEFWHEKFKKVNLHLFISASVDGPSELEFDTRPFKGNNKTKKENIFYDRLFNYFHKYKTGAHPMISKNFLKNYEYNYNFWYENLKKYKCYGTNAKGDQILIIPMFLEVRNEEQWDLDTLENYHNFLKFAAEYDLQNLYNGNLEDFAFRIFDDFTPEMSRKGKYCHTQPYFLGFPGFYSRVPCSIQSGLKIRVGDLAFVPCHRTCYDDLIYGYFSLNDEKTKIIGLNGRNINLAFKIKNFNANRSNLKCSDCEMKVFCQKGCFGAQYEATGELFNAIDSVCDMYLIKYITIHRIALHYNLYDIIINSPYVQQERKEFILYAKRVLTRLDDPNRLQAFPFMQHVY